MVAPGANPSPTPTVTPPPTPTANAERYGNAEADVRRLHRDSNGYALRQLRHLAQRRQNTYSYGDTYATRLRYTNAYSG